ncbi:ABC transporter permease [Candidatus Darwinibacter acetoxidans]|jgi:ABC-2 type transport system permease protein|nr:ABC transporter permease [Limnochordia bacterium]MDI9465199.1 ABC transporter permease [Bacillota bacterium]NLO94691.1 ABC transporter permease [Bacillota bacterium]HOB39880.1 ABC transporter permease [Limnochordia bacterium]HOK31679.1 ABC transporter permease [Limnochordia bacterium]
MKRNFAGTLTLSRFFWRQERRQVVLWALAIVLLNFLVVVSYAQIYKSPAERAAMAQTMRNPAMTFMLGPGWGLDNYTIGAMVGHEMLLFAAMLAAIMNILVVQALTRSSEEDGRHELLLSLPVGSLSSLAAPLVLALMQNAGLALATGLALWVPGVESVDLAGSLLFGTAVGTTGFFFAGLTALFAQLAETSRANLILSLSVLGLLYVLRGLGDLGREWLSLATPLGLILRTQVYVANYWWPVGIMLAAAGVLWTGAFRLNWGRDLGSGYLRARAGRQRASRLLRSPFGLALRLQRSAIISWLCALLLLGASYGSVFADLEEFLAGNEFLREILPSVQGYSLTEQFLSMVIDVTAMLAVIPALLPVVRLVKEEKAGRLESLLALPVSRLNLLLGFLLLGVLVSALAMLASGLGLGLAVQAVLGEGPPLTSVLVASLAQLPGMLVMLGAAVVIVGFCPRFTVLLWAYVAYSVFAVYFGVLINLPQWAVKLSPFGWNPQLPVEPFEVQTALLLLGLAVLLCAAGAWGYVRRDLDL